MSARLRVEVNGKVVHQGTAFPCEGYVVTAFHVVGAREDGLWLHEIQHGVRYSLKLALGCDVELEAVIADSGADVALLKASATALASPLRLARPSDIAGRPWQTVGFPSSIDEGEYALDGTVTRVGESSWWTSRALQLLVNQGTSVAWDGISGAPVIVAGCVVGVLTEYMRDNSTVWASSVGAVRRLISAMNSKWPAETVAVLAANSIAALSTESMQLTTYRTSSFPELVERLDSIANVAEADRVRRTLTRLNAENGPPPLRPSRATLSPCNGETSSPTPDLLTPAGPGSRRELRDLFGEATGDEFATLSESAISVIENGDFEGYIGIGQAIQQKGNEVVSSKIVQDGELLVADGYRLLAGMRPADEESFLRMAMDGFDEVLELAPDNARALRGRACCDQAEHNYGDALRSYNAAIERVQRHLASHAGAIQPLSRRLGDSHELLRLLRHRTEVILLIRRSSSQNRWNTEVGKIQFGQHVEEHERLFRNMMPRMTARPDWYDFECFASHVFLAAALHELGDLGRAAEAALGALRHRRSMIRNGPLNDIQRSNFRWWLRSSRKALSACPGLANKLDDLEHALLTKNDDGVLDSVDRILDASHARV